MNADAFTARLAATRERWIALLEQLTNVECGTEMVEGVAEAGELVAAELRDLGFSVRRVGGGGEFGPHIVAELGGADRPIVLGGHLDTTYTDYAPLPAFHVDGPRAVGPGVSDMKGGIVVLLASLDCLAQAGRLGRCPLAVLFNSDEERGAPSSRDLFREYARRARAALFAESGGASGEVVIARRAKLSYRLDVTGVAQHAGEIPGPTSSAVLDLSHRIIAVEGLNGRFDGASFNAGRAWGGVASNTVAAEATALIDIRFPRAEQEAPIKEAMAAAGSTEHVPGCTAALTLTSFRPAWPETEGSRALAGLVGDIGAGLGQKIEAIARGGTSDANWFGAAGVPTLDGLGPIGFEEHTPGEYTLIDTLFDRALLVASLLDALPAEGAP
ncbi:MAG: M20/M25/M40 family metallo-hydrolase [Planctomycetota bacterium]